MRRGDFHVGRNISRCALFFSDAAIHASMIQGIRHSGAQDQIFRHKDPVDLETVAGADPWRPKLACFELVYSMDGHIARSERFAMSPGTA